MLLPDLLLQAIEAANNRGLPTALECLEKGLQQPMSKESQATFHSFKARFLKELGPRTAETSRVIYEEFKLAVALDGSDSKNWLSLLIALEEQPWVTQAGKFDLVSRANGSHA